MYQRERIRRLRNGTDQDGDRDGARYLIDQLKSSMISGARDPQGTHGTRYRELYVALQATSERMGIRFRLEHDSLGAFVKANPGLDSMPHLLRVSVIDPPFSRLLDALDSPTDRHLFEAVEPGVGGWDRVDGEIAELRALAAGASTGHDRAGVARLCREVFVSLADAIYDGVRHGPLPERQSGQGGGTVKARIEAVIKIEAVGSELTDLRVLMLKALNFANSLQHHKNPADVEAMICADATIFVATALRRVTTTA